MMNEKHKIFCKNKQNPKQNILNKQNASQIKK